jgi:hypothetical protein
MVPARTAIRTDAIASTVLGVTTLWDEGDAIVVRCDSCRRLWPVKRERLDRSGWVLDEETDQHSCPVCAPEVVDPAGRPS